MKYLFTTLLSLLFFTLSAQENVGSTTLSHKSPPRWRLGLIGHNDTGGSIEPYFRRDTGLIARAQRSNGLQVTADYQLLAEVPSFRINAEAGFYRIEAGNNEFRRLRRVQPFYETIEMSYVHLGLGVLFERSTNKHLSPYAGIQLQLALPTDLMYTVDRPTTSQGVAFDRTTIDGGMQASIGWEVSAGLSIRLTPRVTTSLGFYYTYMNFQADWPTLDFRAFPHGLMRLDTGGVELKCLYLF